MCGICGFAGFNDKQTLNNIVSILVHRGPGGFGMFTDGFVSFGHTHSDTKILIHAYEEWGLNFINKICSMFAFKLYDSRKEC